MGVIISALGVAELTLGVGSLVACAVGAAIVWGTYEDEYLSETLHALEKLNNHRDLVTSL
jgi:hypothetical protein